MYNITVTPACLHSGQNLDLEKDLAKEHVHPEKQQHGRFTIVAFVII